MFPMRIHHSLRAAAIAALLALILLAGCHTMPDPLTQPTVMPPSRTAPKLKVYRQCDADGCRLYDGKGQRRYDCERAWSDCDQY